MQVIPDLPIPRLLGVYSSPAGSVSYQLCGMRFSSFDCSPDKFNISIGSALALSLTDISAEINDLAWHFAKDSFPVVSPLTFKPTDLEYCLPLRLPSSAGRRQLFPERSVHMFVIYLCVLCAC